MNTTTTAQINATLDRIAWLRHDLAVAEAHGRTEAAAMYRRQIRANVWAAAEAAR